MILPSSYSLNNYSVLKAGASAALSIHNPQGHFIIIMSIPTSYSASSF